MMTVTGHDLDAAVSSVVTTLRPLAGLDWSVPAGVVEWTCRRTAEHIGDCMLSYAAQLVARPAGRWVRFTAAADHDATPADVLEFAEAAGRVLALTLRGVPADVLADCPGGPADPSGFAAMACVETLLHGADIADGLGGTLQPPPDLCARVVVRLFPTTDEALTAQDPWVALRWSAGRIELPGRPRLTQWRWRAAPPRPAAA